MEGYDEPFHDSVSDEDRPYGSCALCSAPLSREDTDDSCDFCRARSSKDENEIDVWFSGSELELIQRSADQLGISVEELMKNAAMGFLDRSEDG